MKLVLVFIYILKRDGYRVDLVFLFHGCIFYCLFFSLS